MKKGLKCVLGVWVLTRIDGEKREIVIKNQAQAKFLSNNMSVLGIKEWEAKDDYKTLYANA